jgi:hypothetical protein
MAEIMNGASADATVQGTVGTHQTKINSDGKIEAKVVDGKVGAHEINKPTTSSKLAKIGWSNAPLDTFLRNIGKAKTNSDTYQFFSVTARGVACSSTAGATFNAKSFTIPMATGGQSLSKSGVLIAPAYTVDSAGKATKVKTGVALKPAMLHIANVNYSVDPIQVTVAPLNFSSVDTTTGSAVDFKTTFYRAGVACDQDVAITDDPQAMPVKDHNYCQRMLCTISENVYQAMQDKEVEYGLNDFRDQAILDFRLQSEMAAIFGGGAAKGGAIVDGENFTDPMTNKRKLHMRGVLDFDIQHIERGTDDEGKPEDIDTYLNKVMEQMFSVNNGSSERLLIYGAGFATALANSKWWQKQLEANKTEMKWGVTWKMVESNFGSLRGIMDPALSLTGPYSNCALVIDPAHIRLVEQVPLQERKLDLVSAGIRNSKDIVLEESITLELTNPKAHGLLMI